MRVALVLKRGHEYTGVGRYAHQLQRGLQELGCQVTLVYPLVPLPAWLLHLFRRLLGWDLAEFFNTYPLWARYPPADLYHFSSQNLATLLLFCPPPGRSVVTVHDLFPHLLRRDPVLRSHRRLVERLFDRLALAGLRRAGWLIAVSSSTQASLHHHGLGTEKSSVIMEGVS